MNLDKNVNKFLGVPRRTSNHSSVISLFHMIRIISSAIFNARGPKFTCKVMYDGPSEKKLFFQLGGKEIHHFKATKISFPKTYNFFT